MEKKQSKIIIGSATALAVILTAGVVSYSVGKSRYSGKFLPNTSINGLSVSGLNVEDSINKLYRHSITSDSIDITKCDGTKLSISLEDIGYNVDCSEQVEELYNSQNHSAWFTALGDKEDIQLDITPTYNKQKLKDFINSIEWTNVPAENATIDISADDCKLIDGKDGEKTDSKSMFEFVSKGLESGQFSFNEKDNMQSVKPEISSDDLKEQFDTVHKIYNMTVTYDFDYTQEKLEGKQIIEWVSFKDGKIQVDRDKAMKYVESLSKKYDTYDTERKFHATWQGDITVPTSTDAVYGWWIYKDETCDALIDYIKKGDDITTDPIYYYIEDCWGDTDFVYTGLESGRTAESDIGDTYCEVDLSSQHFWYYKDGELQYECDIVSGQPYPSDRKTLPGVYKVWYKATGYTMKGSNSQGSWTSYSDYWTRVAIAGIGLHDTQARTAFGGTIYKRNGSHGCINMPLKGARYVYENVEMGTPVVMYY